jgi:hypothetical protein
VEFLLSLLPMLKQYSGLLAALAGVAVITSKHWMPYLKALKLPGLKPADDPAADISDVEALHLLQARAKRSNCPALKKAVRDVEVCFFNHVDPLTPAKAEVKP